jgi:hypothetical protein
MGRGQTTAEFAATHGRYDPGYDDKIQALAEATRPASEVEGERK